MFNHESNIKEEFKEQVEINLEESFSGASMMPVRKVFKTVNNSVLTLLIFYKNRNNMIFKVLSSLVYCIMDNYVCVYYICCPQTKLLVTSKEQ